MRTPRPIDEKAQGRVAQLLRQTKTKSDFQRVQCVWLRARLGLSSEAFPDHAGDGRGGSAHHPAHRDAVHGHAVRERGGAVRRRPQVVPSVCSGQAIASASTSTSASWTWTCRRPS